MIKLIDLFHIEMAGEPAAAQEPMKPDEALKAAFGILTRQDQSVASEIDECIADTNGFYASRQDILDRRNMKYSPEAEPWLCVIATVEAAAGRGFLRELNADCTAGEFAIALKAVLKAAEIDFSPDRLTFDTQKSLAAWTRQFNEYAGQSGITLYFVDLYSENKVMGAAGISDYAEAAEIAGFAGVRINCRPE